MREIHHGCVPRNAVGLRPRLGCVDGLRALARARIALAALGFTAAACGATQSGAGGGGDGVVVNAQDGGESNTDASLVDGSMRAADGGGVVDAPSDATNRPDAGAADARALQDAPGDAPSLGDAQSPDAGPRCGNAVLGGGPLGTSTTHVAIGVHDPSMIWDGHRYYLFATGGTLNVRSSADMLAWTNAGNIFGSVPAWFAPAIGSTPADLWAPDISYFNGSFHAYYAGSTFGSNKSAIGLATTASLSSPSWSDQGMVVESTAANDFNAIDPNLSFDDNCTPWLAFGSFWSGIKLRQIDPATGHLATSNAVTYSLASRGGGAIEGPSIIAHNGFYYLFVSFDACCKGTSSTYRTMIGRATKITGPYTDKAGKDMMTGAAEELLASSGRYIGPGGGTAWKDGDRYLYAFHYYDGNNGGASELQVRPIEFDATDWITLGNPLFP